MYYAVELHFENALKTRITEAINTVQRNNINPQPICEPINTVQRNNINPQPICEPNLTLLVTPSYSKLARNINNCLPVQGKFPVSFTSIQISPVDNSICLTAFPSGTLMQFQKYIYDALTNKGVQLCEKYIPASWKPLCMLVQSVPEDNVNDAIMASLDLNLPFTGNVEKIAVVEVTPSRHQLLTFDFWTDAVPPPPGFENY